MGGESESKCGCKGVRYCALCLDSERVRQLDFSQKGREHDPKDWRSRLLDFTLHRFCSVCHGVFRDSRQRLDDLPTFSPEQEDGFHERHVEEERLIVEGLVLLPEFVSCDEESAIVAQMESLPWLPSQSGRRKQDFGPRVNFNKKKVKSDRFIGVPAYCDTLLQRMEEQCPALGDYVPLEQCNLEYAPERVATIDFHKDDEWIWGERLISINLLSGSVMSLIQEERKLAILLPMPRRSLLAMFGEMRHSWLHGILSEHIRERRIALTMREPEAKFLSGGELYDPTGAELIRRAGLRVEL